jgi:hypothetical protein
MGREGLDEGIYEPRWEDSMCFVAYLPVQVQEVPHGRSV